MLIIFSHSHIFHHLLDHSVTSSLLPPLILSSLEEMRLWLLPLIAPISQSQKSQWIGWRNYWMTSIMTHIHKQAIAKQFDTFSCLTHINIDMNCTLRDKHSHTHSGHMTSDVWLDIISVSTFVHALIVCVCGRDADIKVKTGKARVNWKMYGDPQIWPKTSESSIPLWSQFCCMEQRPREQLPIPWVEFSHLPTPASKESYEFVVQLLSATRSCGNEQDSSL